MQLQERISITNASVGYKKAGIGNSVLSNINFNFHERDFVGIVGLNGTGKSTLLKSLCGLLPLISGSVRIDGSAINELSLEEIARKVSVVLTEKIGGFNLTAYDVVASGQMPYTDSFNRLKKQNLDIIESSVIQSGINDHRHKLINELSDGLFQKTVIGKALAQQTPVLLLDEPSAFLDYASKHELFILLKHLAKDENKCVLVSSHDLDLVLKYCDKLLLIHNNSTELVPVAEARSNAGFMKIGGGFI